uniref:MCF.2 cell line derived transforming sequence-like 2 n=1 Tax=Electrophorus electricus TaxID=8005 RepID=A0A4W4HN39_ELEEL
PGSVLKEELGAERVRAALSSFTSYEIMQQDIRPLLAVDIIEQLHKQFALLSGGRGRDGAPIITFPEYSGFNELPDEDFVNVVTYLTSIPSLDAASIGFIIIIDRRRDKWSSVKASLARIAGAFPANLQLVLVLRPSRFFQRAIADIGIRLHREDFKMKVPIVMLNSLSDLHGYVDKGQLTCELGGSLQYCHSQWLHHRTAIENFAVTVKSTAQMLQKFGTDLSETELPNDVQCTKDLLTAHTEKRNKLKDELKLAMNQGTTLLSCIKAQASKTESHVLNPDEMDNQTTVERLMAQLDETENAFEQFWSKHHVKLEQCLQLRHFEQDFREVKACLDSLMAALMWLSDLGDCVTGVEQILADLRRLETSAEDCLEKAQLQAGHGEQLIQSGHYAVDSIRPKCVELHHICDDFSNETKKKYDVLSKSLAIHTGIDKVNHWCECGVYLLASQAVDKCQSQEGAETALLELENYMTTAEQQQLGQLKDLYNQNELVLTQPIKVKVQTALKRLEEAEEMFRKRRVSLKKLSAKQTRPVQPVAPRPEASPKRALTKTPRPTGPSDYVMSRLCLSSQNQGLSFFTPRTHARTQTIMFSVVLSLYRHIMTELIETERLYVEELQSIMQGYAAALGDSELAHVIPAVLENNSDVLFGNLPEIYDFHNKMFLRELENCVEKPELVAKCFLKRKEELQVYEKYCQNKPRSEALWRQCGDSVFFQVRCQRRLDHKLSLDAYLLKPVQRITKYQLMLKARACMFLPCDALHVSSISKMCWACVWRCQEMLKCSRSSEGMAELEEALATSAFDGWKIKKYFYVFGCVFVWVCLCIKGHSKVKDLARFKPMQRHLFLYNNMLLFCKKREETSDGHEKSPSYSFKHSLKVKTLLAMQASGSKFEIWYNGREEVYIIQVSA